MKIINYLKNYLNIVNEKEFSALKIKKERNNYFLNQHLTETFRNITLKCNARRLGCFSVREVAYKRYLTILAHAYWTAAARRVMHDICIEEDLKFCNRWNAVIGIKDK